MSNVIRLRPTGIPVDQDTDTALVAAVAAGERAALGELFYRYQRDVYGFLSRLSGTDASELDDLVQNTFLEVRRSADRFENRSSVKSWLFAIAANVARHYVRSSVRRKAAFKSLKAHLDVTATSSDAHDSIERRAMLATLLSAMGELSYKLRVVFVMCDVEGIPGVEAARILGLKEGTLWRRLHDARKRLARAVERRASI